MAKTRPAFSFRKEKKRMFTKTDIQSELKRIPNKDFPKRFENIYKTYHQNNCYIVDVALLDQSKNANTYLFRYLPPKYEVLLNEMSLDIFTDETKAKTYLKDFAKKQRIPEHRLTIKTHSPLDLNV